jgi:hypothetical protein
VNTEIMRAFVRLRGMLESNAELARKLAALEKRYDAQFEVVFDAIRDLMVLRGDLSGGSAFTREVARVLPHRRYSRKNAACWSTARSVHAAIRARAPSGTPTCRAASTAVARSRSYRRFAGRSAPRLEPSAVALPSRKSPATAGRTVWPTGRRR